MWNWRRRGTGWTRGQVPGSRSTEPQVPGRRRCHDGRGRRSCACATATAPGGTWRDVGGDRPSLTPALADATCDRAGPATRGLRGTALVWSDGPLSPRHLVTGHGKPGSGPGSCDGQTLRAWVWPHSSPAGGCAPPVSGHYPSITRRHTWGTRVLAKCQHSAQSPTATSAHGWLSWCRQPPVHEDAALRCDADAARSAAGAGRPLDPPAPPCAASVSLEGPGRNYD